MLSTSNSKLSFIVLGTVKNPIDYEHTQSHNNRPTVKHIQYKLIFARGQNARVSHNVVDARRSLDYIM